MLARRELSVSELRARLLNREHSSEDVDAAIELLTEDGTLDDRRVARAYARAAADVKGRGRLRVQRELHEKGIARDVSAEAIAEVFGDRDERAMAAKALQKKLRHARRPPTQADAARLYQYLMRQGFSPAVAAAEVRKLRKVAIDDDG
jgi:regulatory protein